MNVNRLAPFRNMTVLLAEDDDKVRVPLARSLRMIFDTVLEAEDGPQALALYSGHPAHLAILDIAMPGMSGLEVAAAIRESDADLPILALTGHMEPVFMQQAVRLRLMDYLFKPVNLDALQGALVRCLEEMRQRDRLEVRLAGGVVYHPASGRAVVGEHSVALTANERSFLNYLLRQRGRMAPTHRICVEMAPDEDISPSALRCLVNRLRAKIGSEAVVSSRDIGYMIPREQR